MIRHAPIEGPRPIHAAEFEPTLALCNSVLRADGPPTIAQEYPLVLSPNNAEHMHIISSGGRIASHSACYAMRMHLDENTSVRLGGINSVATDPAFRKRGYASELVNACCDDLRAQGCHLAVLWTEVKGFYEKLGFQSLGSQLLYRVTRADMAKLKSDLRVAPASERDYEAMGDLRSEAYPYIERTPEEWRQYLTIPRMRAWVARRDGRCVAYAIVGKGEDFQGCCHEWGGAPKDALAVLAHAADAMPRGELIVLSPDERDGVNRALQRTGAAHIQTPLGMFRCLDPAGMFCAIEERLRALTASAWTFEESDGQWQLSVGEEMLPPLSTEEWCAMLLGPQRPSELVGLSKRLARVLDSAFPLPVFIWGLDSV